METYKREKYVVEFAFRSIVDEKVHSVCRGIVTMVVVNFDYFMEKQKPMFRAY